jgi:phage FluMu protein Com
MKCPRCQAANAHDAAFCDECGARLEVACPTCGEMNRAATAEGRLKATLERAFDEMTIQAGCATPAFSA